MSSEADPKAAGIPAAGLGLRIGCAIFAFALGVRLLHLWQIADAPFFPLLMGDAEAYHLWASEIAAGDWLGDRVFYQAPLYPYFIASLYALGAESPLWVKLCQALLGAGSCVLLAGAGARFFSLPAGVLAGLMLALYAPAIFFDGLIQKSSLDLFFVCLVLWWIASLTQRQSAWRWLALGASLGALILTRENALVLLLPIGVWAVALRAGTPAQRLLPVLWLLLGVAALLLPVALRNLAVGGELHLTTSQLGTNLYIGNNEAANGGYQPLRYGRGNWAHEREDATELAERELGRPLSPAEVSSYWTDRALDFITNRPGDWALLMGRKLLLLANAVEWVDTEDQYTHAEWSLPLRVSGPLMHFGVIAPLALLGVIVSWRRRPALWLLLALPLCYAASVMLFYVFARYRHPLAPFLLLFAAAGVVGIPGFVREAGRARLAGAVAAVLGAALLCNWPLGSERRMRSATHLNVGVALRQLGDFEAARLELERALAFDPENPLAHHSLGTLLYLDDELDASARHLRTAIGYKPEHAPSHARLGMTLSRMGHAEPALPHYRRALELDPQLALAHYNLGLNLIVLGRVEEARERLRDAVRLDPKNRERIAGRALAAATARQAGPRAAIEALRLAQYAVEFGEGESAIALDALAAAHAANRQLPQALQVADAALALAARDPAVSAELESAMRARRESYRAR